MKIKDIVNVSKGMMDQGLQATETALELFVHTQQHGAERLHEAIEGSMVRSQKAALSSLGLWKDGVTAGVGVAQGVTRRMRAGLAMPEGSK